MNKIILFLISLACLLFFQGCTKQSSEGPDLESFFGEFYIIDSLSLDNYIPNFEMGESVGFSAEFSTIVDWKISITGLSSGSKKEILGESNEINPEQILWSGETSSLPFFDIEECVVELTFPDYQDVVLIDSLQIEGLKVYEGIMITDFEDGIPANSCSWRQEGGSMTFDLGYDNALEGQAYYKMGGIVGWDWVLGALDIPLNLNDVTTSSNDFFLNLGVLSGDANGSYADNQFINIMISEEQNIPFNDDLSNNLSDLFESNMEVYQYKIQPVDWSGWQYFGIPYSDFEEKNAGVPGVTYSRDPNDITAIRIQCQACPWNSSSACPNNQNIAVRTDVDFIIFTENNPVLY